MRRRIATSLATVTLVVLGIGAAPAAAATSSARPVAATKEDALRAALDRVTAAGLPGTFAEVRNGHHTWRGASGVADVVTGRAMRPGYQHRVASITKTFVATTVLQLVAERKIALDAPLGQYLPEYARDGATVRTLLNHTSTIGNYISVLFADPATDIERYRTETVPPRELARLGLAMPPTAGYAYSNTNFVLLGLIIEKVTGRPAAAEITRRIIRPLGLRGTYFPGTYPHIAGPHAKAYIPWFDGELRDFSVYNMSWLGMAGELVSTTADLDRFYRALLTGRLLRPAEMTAMRTVVPWDEATPEAGGYGLGIYSVALTCGPVWGHDGLALGHSTFSWHSPDGSRQATIALNMTHYQIPGEPDLILGATLEFLDLALCGPTVSMRATSKPFVPVDRFSL
ncbi:serine hydrolase domain-containing protein [Paractinoplanes rishiriensis]|uniref:Serine hydrolase n=1 Tax=Paractinoplanes rishiriensis TaxID=1050105 RepID=A0A919JVN4_9ACTN|nr:serine hydrolase domain-containing protein [Actinoplanes rishiriensis]GIE94450.1 serine hydrolase [Actinoplanes rishiriensis]